MSTAAELSATLKAAAEEHRNHVARLARARAAADALLDHIANTDGDELDREIVDMLADVITDRLSYVNYTSTLADTLTSASEFLATVPKAKKSRKRGARPASPKRSALASKSDLTVGDDSTQGDRLAERGRAAAAPAGGA